MKRSAVINANKTQLTMNTNNFDYLTITPNSMGQFIIHGWGTHTSGVLKGQHKKVYIEAFYDLEDAQAAYPDATLSNKWMQPQHSFNHLPDERY